MRHKPTADRAYEAWMELAFFNSRTDLEANRLLEGICRQSGAPCYTADEDPIYYSIKSLTNAGRRQFLDGCGRIRASITEDKRENHRRFETWGMGKRAAGTNG